jgi:hypothetical protein
MTHKKKSQWQASQRLGSDSELSMRELKSYSVVGWWCMKNVRKEQKAWISGGNEIQKLSTPFCTLAYLSEWTGS